MTTPEVPPAREPADTDVGLTDTERTDEQRLAELGYKQELSRAWSAFTNFAISFTIISVLAGTFTTFLYAWNNGGPIAVSIGWPVLCFFVLMVAFSMAELTSKYPTAGGPYWWALPTAAEAAWASGFSWCQSVSCPRRTRRPGMMPPPTPRWSPGALLRPR